MLTSWHSGVSGVGWTAVGISLAHRLRGRRGNVCGRIGNEAFRFCPTLVSGMCHVRGCVLKCARLEALTGVFRNWKECDDHGNDLLQGDIR